ncbi:MAG: trypsin-like peptidase domain-containing protein [Clostridia bacterium]|nr:trypsin-like peptidase domain-containing protein [Clostridia bacterium]
MKQYPYSESTDMVVYDIRNAENEKKKKKRPNTWVVAISSALAASVFTMALTAGLQFSLGHSKNGLYGSASYTNGNAGGTAESAATTLATKSDGDELTIPEIAAKVGPAVVGVINKTTVQPRQFWDPFSGRYYYDSDPSQSDEMVEQGSGSGIIINTDGYLVTNQHVIDGAKEVEVILNTGTTYTAEIVGQDTKTDLAVLKITPKAEEPLTAAVLGDSSALQVGELAVAIGNPMGMEFSGSVTAGIISAVNRSMTIENRTYNLIQTDAAINSGNSGGALINRYGEVIGINSVKLSTTGVEGMGFAIAISEVKPIIDDLMSTGYVTGRPLVGIGIKETGYGLFISQVSEGSGAADAGLKTGDMILEVDGQKVKSTAEINKIRDTKKPGDVLKFKILREGETMEVNVTLKEDTTNKKAD